MNVVSADPPSVSDWEKIKLVKKTISIYFLITKYLTIKFWEKNRFALLVPKWITYWPLGTENLLSNESIGLRRRIQVL